MRVLEMSEFTFLSKCRVLIFFNDLKTWEKYKRKFSSNVIVKESQWEGGLYVIITDLEKSQVDLNELKGDPNVYKIIFQVDKE